MEATIRAATSSACTLTCIDTSALSDDEGLVCYRNVAVPGELCCPCWIWPTHELDAFYENCFGSRMEPDLPDADSTAL